MTASVTVFHVGQLIAERGFKIIEDPRAANCARIFGNSARENARVTLIFLQYMQNIDVNIYSTTSLSPPPWKHESANKTISRPDSFGRLFHDPKTQSTILIGRVAKRDIFSRASHSLNGRLKY